MKLLFQGGWTQGRDPTNLRQLTESYCAALAEHVVNSRHELILTSSRGCDSLIANTIAEVMKRSGGNPKDKLIYYIPDRDREMPEHGRVFRMGAQRWWIDERTYFVQNSDALIAIGGGKGTSYCIDKAFLSKKPVFMPCQINTKAVAAWHRHSTGYYYSRPGDADFNADISTNPTEYFTNVFAVLDKLNSIRYDRRVFIVHGRDYNARNTLATILRQLSFEPIILQREPHAGLTIIEQLERDVARVGFGFVLYTPDDQGALIGETARPRARQNVIFEHGLLVGVLGRDRICALVHGDIEIPSDYHGVLYERFLDLDDEAIKIARVLKQAGYEVDASSLV